MCERQDMEILFVGKKNDQFANDASKIILEKFSNAKVIFGNRGEEFPSEFRDWKGDFLLSYLSPWIIPKELLINTRKGAINWHPGPPEYPGIGCTNFATYNGEKEFGITCHFMQAKVDTGKLIEVKRFSLTENESVFSMTQRCYELIFESFQVIINKIENRKALPFSEENWTRKPYTRKELDALCLIGPEMSSEVYPVSPSWTG
jgi:methionyl-tRNA formyltransferase